jgi:hypothetical protein
MNTTTTQEGTEPMSIDTTREVTAYILTWTDKTIATGGAAARKIQGYRNYWHKLSPAQQKSALTVEHHRSETFTTIDEARAFAEATRETGRQYWFQVRYAGNRNATPIGWAIHHLSN